MSTSAVGNYFPYIILLTICLLINHSVSGYDDSNLVIDIGFEVKTHVRHSDKTRFSFPFTSGSRLWLETVDDGTHLEVSTISLMPEIAYNDVLTSRVKLDLIDIYDRNPTSEDKQVDIDEYWLRYGAAVSPGRLPVDDGRNLYLKIGKFGKFERQTDRHLESYGLSATVFNRFEDQGIEAGFDILPNLYIKGSLTAGNPVFMRDPNALAGDNGTGDALRRVPRRKSGFPVLYDAEVEDFDFHDNSMETGVGFGYRFGNDEATRTIDVMVFGYERDLRKTVGLNGTRYGGDRDLLELNENDVIDVNSTLNDLTGNYKREYGFNIWLYFDDLTVFYQFIDQDIGGLDRDAWELELSYKFNLPQVWTIGENQLFASISPAARYSFLNPDFAGSTGTAGFPAPSIFWDWEKIDIGVQLGILPGVSLTCEYNLNELETARGDLDNDEFLTTLKWRHFF